MKKTIALLSIVVTALALVAISTGFTLAYFKDKDTTDGMSVSASNLEVSVDIKLANYGVPSDTLITSYGNNDTPDKSTVTVTNKGSLEMEYTLSLMVNKATANLLDTNGLELRDTDNEPLQFLRAPTTDAAGNVTYIYKINSVLETGESDVFGLALKLKGATLLEGNDFQGVEISVTPTVEATQTMGGVGL